jgi:prepilin-type N-terminal cleavage/methylation domain-containing protein
MKVHKKGFTLLEITVALTIFVIGIMAILTLFMQGTKMKKTQMADIMLNIAADNLLEKKKNELENSRHFSLSDISFSKNKSYPVFNSTKPQNSDAGIYVFDEKNNSLFNCIYEMKITDHASLDQVKQIKISLKEEKNKTTKQFCTLVSRKDGE